MKRRIIIGSLLAVCILLLVPSISAVEYATVLEKNKNRFLDDIKTIDIDVLEHNLKTINDPRIQESLKSIDFSLFKQKIADITADTFYIDFELIMILILNILATFIVGFPTPRSLGITLLCIIGIIAEFYAGEPYLKCNNVHILFFMSFVNLFCAILWKTIPSKIIGYFIVLIIYYAGLLAVSTFVNVAFT